MTLQVSPVGAAAWTAIAGTFMSTGACRITAAAISGAVSLVEFVVRAAAMKTFKSALADVLATLTGGFFLHWYWSGMF